MKDKLLAAQAAALDGFRGALAYAGAHRFWVESAAITLFGLLALVAYGSAALSRSSALRAQAEELRTVQDAFARWRAELRPAAPAESLLWRESEQSLRAVGGEAARPLTVARLVAQRAEEAGIEDLRISVLPADSITPLKQVRIGGWAVEADGDGLLVEFDGDMTDVVGFLGALPTQAAVTSLQLNAAQGGLHARIVLLTRRISEAG